MGIEIELVLKAFRQILDNQDYIIWLQQHGNWNNPDINNEQDVRQRMKTKNLIDQIDKEIEP